MATPYAIVRFASVGSTQDEARARCDGMRPVLVVADEQRRGRGRSGHAWENAPRAVASSLALRPAWPVATWPRLPLVAGLAVRDAIGAVLGTEVGLKWPNDLVDAAERKVGGILVESAGTDVVVGVGLNLWWPEPPDGVAGIVPDDPGRDAVDAVAEAWTHRFLARLEAGPDDWGRDEYTAVCRTLGRRVTWEPDGVGDAVDVADDGALVVRLPDGSTTELRSAAVRTVRAASLPQDPERGASPP